MPSLKFHPDIYLKTSGDNIFIVAVMHLSRQPYYWRKRTE